MPDDADGSTGCRLDMFRAVFASALVSCRTQFNAFPSLGLAEQSVLQANPKPEHANASRKHPDEPVPQPEQREIRILRKGV